MFTESLTYILCLFILNIHQEKQLNNLGKHSHHHPHFPSEKNEAQVGKELALAKKFRARIQTQVI